MALLAHFVFLQALFADSNSLLPGGSTRVKVSSPSFIPPNAFEAMASHLAQDEEQDATPDPAALQQTAQNGGDVLLGAWPPCDQVEA